MNQSNYFDLEDILVNELVGDIWLLLLVGLIIIWIILIKANVPFKVGTLITALWIAIIFSFAFDAIILVWILMVLSAATLFYFNVSKAIKRG